MKCVRAMALEETVVLLDLFDKPSNSLASFRVQNALGASLAQMDVLTRILLICFGTLHWERPTLPFITAQLQEAVMSGDRM